MSKELAQTVGGKRALWLFAIIAAFAVFAMLATPWGTARADHASDIQVEVEVVPDEVEVGDEATYTVSILNDGTQSNSSGNSEFTITIPGGVFFSVDLDLSDAGPYECDPQVYDPAEDEITIYCVNTDTHAIDGEHTIDIDVQAAVAGSHTVSVAGRQGNNLPGNVIAEYGPISDTLDVDAAGPTQIVHLDPWGDVLVDDNGLEVRDDENNLVGFRHHVCLYDGAGDLVATDQDTGLAISASDRFIGIITNLASVTGNEDDLQWLIAALSGTVSVNGQALYGDEISACVEWWSAGPGEQNITVVDGLGEVIGDFSGFEPPFDVPLVKEWNLLEPTAITFRGDDGENPANNLDGETLTAPFFLNTQTNLYQSAAPIELDEHVFGSHIMAGGGEFFGLVDGAVVTFSVAGNCGYAVIDPDGDTVAPGAAGPGPHWIGTGGEVTVISAGIPINFDIATDDCASQNNSHTIVNIDVEYPQVIGSGTGYPVPDRETIRVNWERTADAKNQWLAWAGQRTVIEANWGIPGLVDGEPGTICPFGETQASPAALGVSQASFNSIIADLGSAFGIVQFLRSSTFGTFDPSSEAFVLGTDQAFTLLDENCAARVIFESEDPGQVDVEAFIIGHAASKQAFVIYYMKFEDVNVSLVTQVEKESHNGSHGANRDWTPGTPWDESEDVLDTDWNVSKDLLVRVRVRGWFTNSNPSGRPAAGEFGSENNPPRPADRWIMPDDWGLLLGGSLDGQVAIEQRPEYDIMFAPFRGAVPDPEFVASEVIGTELGDGYLDKWDAPMPPAPVTIDIRGAGFIKSVLKTEVYHNDGVVGLLDNYTNPYYFAEIPDHPALPANQYEWNTFGGDGWYEFWEPALIGINPQGNPGESLSSSQLLELDQIRAVYGDDTIARRLTVYSDNHGEAMVAANGDFNLTYDDCATNAIAGGQHCDVDDVVGSSSIFATADYPDLRKHPVMRSNTASVDWTWGGYKTITIEDGETPQFKYVVFRAVDRDGFCSVPSGAVSLHPVLTSADQAVADAIEDAGVDFHDGSVGVGPGAQIETVDFLIDSDEGGRFVNVSEGGEIGIGHGFAGGVPTFVATPGSQFEPLRDGDECQAWVRISNSLLGITNVLVIAHNDEGDVGFDALVDFQDEFEYTLNFRWSLVPWAGADNIPVEDALSGTGLNDGGTDISDDVIVVYGWEAQSQSWLAYFTSGVDIPGANDLTHLQQGQAYWISITGPGSITWTVKTNVN